MSKRSLETHTQVLHLLRKSQNVPFSILGVKMQSQMKSCDGCTGEHAHHPTCEPVIHSQTRQSRHLCRHKHESMPDPTR